MNEKLFNIYTEELKELINSKHKQNGLLQTQIGSLSMFRETKPVESTAVLYEPSLCIAVQGSKSVGIGNNLFEYDINKYLLASIHSPAIVKIENASEQKPYLSLKLSFSVEQVFDVIKDIKDVKSQPSRQERGLYFGDMSLNLLEPLTKLVRLLDDKQHKDVLAPLIIKEILLVLMLEKGGDFIRQYAKDGSAIQRVVQAISYIKENLQEKLNIATLARQIGMSESSLYGSFKKVTLMSPIQFQKSLRLQEARKMLVNLDTNASEVAFRVGYESPSQFSREYSRMFGMPPILDSKKLKKEIYLN